MLLHVHVKLLTDIMVPYDDQENVKQADTKVDKSSEWEAVISQGRERLPSTLWRGA